MDGSHTTPSPQLIEANRRLHALRVQMRHGRPVPGKEDLSGSACRLLADTPAQGSGLPPRVGLPAHLGWGSGPLTAVLRRQAPESSAGAARFAETAVTRVQGELNDGNKQSDRLSLGSPRPSARDWVKLYPDIGLGMLREEMTAPGRLWLLLRYLDTAGQGALRIDIIKQTLTPKSSTLRLCGKRQLRNLLKAGDGIFWVWGRQQVWLRSAARVAAALDVARLTGKPVALPLAALLGGIGDFRAHLYAAFHSGRAKETPQGRQAMPLARATLTAVSGVGASSQRKQLRGAGGAAGADQLRRGRAID